MPSSAIKIRKNLASGNSDFPEKAIEFMAVAVLCVKMKLGVEAPDKITARRREVREQLKQQKQAAEINVAK